jgi:hypothetical protein
MSAEDRRSRGGEAMADERQDWHRMFGVSWFDFLTGQPMTVDPEIDLSMKVQLLDLALIRKGKEPLTVQMPDGFDDLSAHNLVSYKSFQETLDGRALNELIGHYANYQKQVSPSMSDLLDESEFRLFAVTVRYPRLLADRRPMRELREGVYEMDHFSGTLRVIVIRQLPQQPQNAGLLLFSGLKHLVKYGKETYKPRSDETTNFIQHLLRQYEETNVPVDMKEFAREVEKELVARMTPEQREKLLATFPVNQRLAGLNPDEQIEALSPEAIEVLRKRFEAEKRAPGGAP